jgi:hypothetical protein
VLRLSRLEPTVNSSERLLNCLGVQLQNRTGDPERLIRAPGSRFSQVAWRLSTDLSITMPDFGALVSRYRDYSHGEWGLRAYTNARGVLYYSTRLDLGVRYPP